MHLAGELDLATADELSEHLTVLSQTQNRPQIAMDLTDLPFCGASGLTVFVRTGRACAARDGWMHLERPSR